METVKQIVFKYETLGRIIKNSIDKHTPCKMNNYSGAQKMSFNIPHRVKVHYYQKDHRIDIIIYKDISELLFAQILILGEETYVIKNEHLIITGIPSLPIIEASTIASNIIRAVKLAGKKVEVVEI